MKARDEQRPSAARTPDPVSPLRKYFDEVAIGDDYTTPARTITEADVVNFACLTGDFYYLHVDREAARQSHYGRRIAHGFLVLSIGTGLMVTSRPGPVVANYGADKLRFVRPVFLGDTIRTRLQCVQKRARAKPMRNQPVGVVDWKIRVMNQNDQLVATWIFKTLVLCSQ